MSRRTFYILTALFALGFLCGILLLLRRPVPTKEPGKLSSAFSRGSVVVVELYGPIYISQKSSRFGFVRDSDRIVRRLHRLSQQQNVKAVVLRINSPGGSVAAVQEICREVNLLRRNGKVVVASLGDIAASGGYYVASQTDRIVADQGTLTGSIGVIMQVANIQELFRKIGVRIETVRTGQFKDIGSPYRELTPAERQLLQNLINDAYTQFVDAVAQGRKMDRNKVLDLADGRIFTGSQAKASGLIDDFGNSEEAIATAAQLAHLDNPRIVYETETDSFGQFLSLLGESSELKLIPSQLLSERKIRLDYMAE